MSGVSSSRRDYYAAVFAALIGAGAIGEARTYDLGTLVEMGPGFFPLALGCILVFCSLLLALTARYGAAEPDALHAVGAFDLRGTACILGGIIAFVLLGPAVGMVIAVFAAVFISASGDRSSTIKSSLGLAAAVTLFGVVLFHFGLKLPFPLFPWGSA